MHAGVAWEVRRQAGSAGICAAHGAQQGKDERYLVHLNCCSETEKPEGVLFNTEFGLQLLFLVGNHCLNRGKTYFANEAPPGKKKQIQCLT